jgi:hypothetical protein
VDPIGLHPALQQLKKLSVKDSWFQINSECEQARAPNPLKERRRNNL